MATAIVINNKRVVIAFLLISLIFAIVAASLNSGYPQGDSSFKSNYYLMIVALACVAAALIFAFLFECHGSLAAQAWVAITLLILIILGCVFFVVSLAILRSSTGFQMEVVACVFCFQALTMFIISWKFT